jgi:hypothetical protein
LKLEEVKVFMILALVVAEATARQRFSPPNLPRQGSTSRMRPLDFKTITAVQGHIIIAS